MSHNSVAEYGKNIATKTSSYTDELLNLVQNKDLDATGQKLNQVVQVAQQLNTSSILNKKKSSGFLGNIISKFKGVKDNLTRISIPPKNRLMCWSRKLKLRNRIKSPR